MKNRIENFIFGFIIVTCAHLYVYTFCWRYGHWITQTYLNPFSPTATKSIALFCEGVAWLLLSSVIYEVLLRRYSPVLTEKRWIALGCMSMLGTSHLLAVTYYPSRYFEYEILHFLIPGLITLLSFMYLVRFQRLFLSEKTGFDLVLGFTFVYPWFAMFASNVYQSLVPPYAQADDWAERIARFVIPLFLALPTLFPAPKMKWVIFSSMLSIIVITTVISNLAMMRWLVDGEIVQVYYRDWLYGMIFLFLWTMVFALPGRGVKLFMDGFVSLKARFQPERAA